MIFLVYTNPNLSEIFSFIRLTAYTYFFEKFCYLVSIDTELKKKKKSENSIGQPSGSLSHHLSQLLYETYKSPLHKRNPFVSHISKQDSKSVWQGQILEDSPSQSSSSFLFNLRFPHISCKRFIPMSSDPPINSHPQP